MSKKDPKIIRCDDRVKITTPDVFVRCGYPLGIEDMKKEVEEKYGNDIDRLIQVIWKGGHTDYKMSMADRSKDRTYQNILRELAYVRLQAEKYGGNERKIFTKTYEDIRNKVFHVTGVRFVKTGVRVPGTGGGYYDEDADPPYFAAAKTHKILILDLCRQDIDEHFRAKHIHSSSIFKYAPIEIEAKNTEKLPDDRELIQDKDGNWVKNEMYQKETA